MTRGPATRSDPRGAVAGRRILLTGASGFVGAALLDALLAEGARPVALGRRALARPGVESVEVETWTAPALERALAAQVGPVDGVFHLAAYGVTPSERCAETMFEVNVACARAVLRHAIARKAGFFVQAGSSSEYASRQGAARFVETAPLETARLYGASKAAAGVLLCAEAEQADFPCAVARIFGVYGPGEKPHRLLPSLVARLGRGDRVALSAGAQIRDFLYIADAVAGLLALAEAVADGRGRVVANLATGVGTSVADFARAVADALGAPHALLGFGDLAMRPDDDMHRVGDPRRIAALTGWAPAFALREGVAASIATGTAGRT